MDKLRWYFKNGTRFEEYSKLYEDEKFILVLNDKTKKYSFGVKEDFGSLYGFPVNQSCLAEDEVNSILHAFVDIENTYLDSLGEIAEKNIDRWNGMLSAIQQYN